MNLDESLGFLLNRAAFAMRRALEHRLKPHGLTAPQWAILARLVEKDAQSPGAIGKSLHMDKPTTTGIVDRMEKKGLVKRTRNATDRRVVHVTLTAKGRNLFEKLPPLAKEVNQVAARGIGPEDAEQIKRLLRKIWDNHQR